MEQWWGGRWREGALTTGPTFNGNLKYGAPSPQVPTLNKSTYLEYGPLGPLGPPPLPSFIAFWTLYIFLHSKLNFKWIGTCRSLILETSISIHPSIHPIWASTNGFRQCLVGISVSTVYHQGIRHWTRMNIRFYQYSDRYPDQWLLLLRENWLLRIRSFSYPSECWYPRVRWKGRRWRRVIFSSPSSRPGLEGLGSLVSRISSF